MTLILRARCHEYRAIIIDINIITPHYVIIYAHIITITPPLPARHYYFHYHYYALLRHYAITPYAIMRDYHFHYASLLSLIILICCRDITWHALHYIHATHTLNNTRAMPHIDYTHYAIHIMLFTLPLRIRHYYAATLLEFISLLRHYQMPWHITRNFPHHQNVIEWIPTHHCFHLHYILLSLNRILSSGHTSGHEYNRISSIININWIIIIITESIIMN